MLNDWSTQRLFIYTININSYTLTPNQANYTIGPTGNFSAPRPLRIDTARILVAFGNVYVGVKDLDIITQPEFVELSDKSATAIVPEKLYNDGGYPLSTLSLWPTPTQNASRLELGTWTALTEFANLQSVFSFPPGYYAAILWNLVVELGPGYNKPPNEATAAKALAGMAAIQGLNRMNGMADMNTQPANPSQPSAGQAGPQ